MADVPSTLVEEDQHQIPSQVAEQVSDSSSLQIDNHPENYHEQFFEEMENNLSCFNKWWSRMEREGVKLDKERLQMMKKVRKLNENEKMKRFLEQNLVKTKKNRM